MKSSNGDPDERQEVGAMSSVTKQNRKESNNNGRLIGGAIEAETSTPKMSIPVVEDQVSVEYDVVGKEGTAPSSAQDRDPRDNKESDAAPEQRSKLSAVDHDRNDEDEEEGGGGDDRDGEKPDEQSCNLARSEVAVVGSVLREDGRNDFDVGNNTNNGLIKDVCGDNPTNPPLGGRSRSLKCNGAPLHRPSFGRSGSGSAKMIWQALSSSLSSLALTAAPDDEQEEELLSSCHGDATAYSRCFDPSVRRVASEDVLTPSPCTSNSPVSDAARTKVDNFFRKSMALEHDINSAQIPKFNIDELMVGKFLGRGGFSDVDEIRGMSLCPTWLQPERKEEDFASANDKVDQMTLGKS